MAILNYLDFARLLAGFADLLGLEGEIRRGVGVFTVQARTVVVGEHEGGVLVRTYSVILFPASGPPEEVLYSLAAEKTPAPYLIWDVAGDERASCIFLRCRLSRAGFTAESLADALGESLPVVAALDRKLHAAGYDRLIEGRGHGGRRESPPPRSLTQRVTAVVRHLGLPAPWRDRRSGLSQRAGERTVLERTKEG